MNRPTRRLSRWELALRPGAAGWLAASLSDSRWPLAEGRIVIGSDMEPAAELLRKRYWDHDETMAIPQAVRACRKNERGLRSITLVYGTASSARAAGARRTSGPVTRESQRRLRY